MNNRLLYIEATSGVSGDMLLGAFLDLGVPVEILNEGWTALGIDNYEVEIFETRKSGLRALQCRVKTTESSGPRTWKEYQRILNESQLPEPLKSTTLKLCKQLFEVEAGFHGERLERLHLHEMGGTDLLIDVVGVLSAASFLNANRILSSPVNTGRGFLKFSHGTYPVPAPATAKLLEGIPVFQNDVEGELCTPTGALLLRHLSKSFGPMPVMKLEKTGIGAGEKDTGPHPNVVRIFQGTPEINTDSENVLMVETNIDDSNPQLLALFMEKAFQEGALDVFFTPVIMKKNRPAVRVTVLLPSITFDSIAALIFEETTAIGLRYWKVERVKQERRWKEIKVRNHVIRIKEGYYKGKVMNYQPEFEDCRAASEILKIPAKKIIAEAISNYLSKESAPKPSSKSSSRSRRKRS